jgi:hypothetical protein
MSEKRLEILINKEKTYFISEVHCRELFSIEKFCARCKRVMSQLPIFLNIILFSINFIKVQRIGSGLMHLHHINDLSDIILT